MAKQTKRKQELNKLIGNEVSFSLNDALSKIKSQRALKFDESVDVAINLGVDPRKADQMVRGTCSLPHGTGKTMRILVLAKADKVLEGKEAGADFSGGEELIEKIKSGWLDFDRIVATPDMMSEVGKVGRILGPRGLMPNPKVGTVTFDVKSTVAKIKAGMVEFKIDKAGVVHAPVGRVSFSEEKLAENISTFISTVRSLRPQSMKGNYMHSVTVNSTMGAGYRLSGF